MLIEIQRERKKDIGGQIERDRERDRERETDGVGERLTEKEGICFV